MSIKTMTAIWDQSKQKGGKLLLLLALADYADDQGYCWPSEKTLAKKIRMSARHVRRMADDMQQAGELYVKSGQETGQSNRYVVMAGLSRETFADVLTKKIGAPDRDLASIVSRYFDPKDSAALPGIGGGGQNVLPPELGGVGLQSPGGVGLQSPGGVGLQSPTNRHITVNESPTPAPNDLPPVPRLPAAGNGAKAPGGAAEESKAKTKQAEVAPAGDGINRVKLHFAGIIGRAPHENDQGRWASDIKKLLKEFGVETIPLMDEAWKIVPPNNRGNIQAPWGLRTFMLRVKGEKANSAASAASDSTVNTGAGYRPPGLSDEEVELYRVPLPAQRAGAGVVGGAA